MRKSLPWIMIVLAALSATSAYADSQTQPAWKPPAFTFVVGGTLHNPAPPNQPGVPFASGAAPTISLEQFTKFWGRSEANVLSSLGENRVLGSFWWDSDDSVYKSLLDSNNFELFASALREAIAADSNLSRSVRVEYQRYDLFFHLSGADQEDLTRKINYFFEAWDNAWASRRMQILHEAIDKELNKQDEIQAQLKEKEAALAAAKTILEKIQPSLQHDPNYPNELAKEAVLLNTEVVGLKAKLEAARKFMAELPEKSTAARAAAESSLVSTEIDMAGCSARQARLGEIIEALRLSPSINGLQNTLRQSSMYLQQLKDSVDSKPQPFRPAYHNVALQTVVLPEVGGDSGKAK